MKNSAILLFATLLVSGTILAKPPANGAIDYVFQANTTAMLDESPYCTQAQEDLGREDVWHIQQAELYSMQTKKTNGKILKDNIKKVGDMVVCLFGPSTNPQWTFEFTAPRSNYEIMYFISVDDRLLFATGLLTFRTGYFEAGIPVPGTLLSTMAANVLLRYGPGPLDFRTIGTLTSNYLLIEPGADVEGYQANGIITIRLYE